MDVRLNAGNAHRITQSECNATKLELRFASTPQIELIQTNFKSPLLPDEICAVRGKTAGAYSNGVTFQWTAAVQALCVLLLKATAHCMLGRRISTPLLEGAKRSMASSLDASIYKQTGWLDLFGSDIRGDSLSRRVLLRTNPGRRRPGPVMISLNERVLPAKCIKVYVDSKTVTDVRLLNQYTDSIETSWNTERGMLIPLTGPSLENPLRI